MPRKPETHASVMVSNIWSMRSGAQAEDTPGAMFADMQLKLGDRDAALDLIAGAARLMDVREATSFLHYLITEGREDLIAMTRKHEAEKIVKAVMKP
jgi:hypothetical protein